MLVGCEWGNWEDWLKCSTSCGGGVQVRTRRPITYNEPIKCSGSFIDHQPCNTRPCPEVETLQNDVAELKELRRVVEQLKYDGMFEFHSILVF